LKKYLLIFFVIVLYSQGLLKTLGTPQLFIDGILLLIPIILLVFTKRKLKVAPGWQLVLAYFIWSIIAGIYHQENLLRPILFSRYLVIGYLILWAIYNTYFNEKQIKQIVRVVFVMFFIQIFAALYEIFFIGRTEAMVGTMMSGGGGPATTFPMFAFAFMFSFFLFTQKYKHIIAAFSFLIVGYASGKLGVYFLIPLIAFIAIVMFNKYHKVNILSGKIFKNITIMLSLILLIALILPNADKRTERLNLGSLSIIDRIERFINFSFEASNKSVDSEYTGSRSATSLRIINETFNRPPNVFFMGQGFDAYESIGHSFGEGAFEEYGIVYGITGWSYDALIYGWPLMFFHVGFFVFLFIRLNKIRKKYRFKYPWNVYLFSSQLVFFVFLFNYFFYNNNYTVGGWMIFIHMYFYAILLSPHYRKFFLSYS
jgi:hypothetical protein